jgi:hypothetical protein
MVLIDYDSLYVPSLAGYDDYIKGLAGYQHPQRFAHGKTNEKLDYFSELIIFTSIIALAENPKLWDKYGLSGTEELLFRKEDFKSFSSTRIYRDLNSLSEPIKKCLNTIKEFLSKNNIQDLLPLDQVIDFEDIAKKISEKFIKTNPPASDPFIKTTPIGIIREVSSLIIQKFGKINSLKSNSNNNTPSEEIIKKFKKP